MTSRLRIVAFTGSHPTAVDRVFFERLARDPVLDLVAIVVDEYQPKRKFILRRVMRSVRDHGARWLLFKLGSKLRALVERATLRIFDAIHGPRREESWKTQTVIHRVADIHSPESLTLIRSLSPDLGIIVGGRILRDSVIAIPKYGTLNIHKRKLPDYRGGGPVGYWEIAAGEPSIGISIHYAIPAVDAGPVLAETTIPIETCDTLESLKIKADLRGAQLYHETLQRFAAGERDGVPQDPSRGRTYRAPSEYEVWRLQRRLERKAAETMDQCRLSAMTRLRVIAQYLLALPHLLAVKRRLIRERRAPISIFFYHLVADSPLNNMCVRLPAFVRQMEFLRRYFTVLSLDEAVERLASGKNDEVATSITFDDGYRDNAWAVEYLRYFGIPASFFISIGHVRDGTAFEHDRKRGYEHALPMAEADIRRLRQDGFIVGSHGFHHEDFGTLTPAIADQALRASRDQIKATCGATPKHFAFPKGKRGTNITTESFALALKHYPYIYSAYGGYCLPQIGRRHFLRRGHPTDVLELALVMTGYTGFRDCLTGNAWGLETEKLDPRTSAPVRRNTVRSDGLRVALIAASPDIIGGQSIQAQALAADLRNAGHDVSFIPIDVRFPRGLRWLRRLPYARTLLNEALYLPSLHRIARADVVHVFSASYWSFLLAPAPAILAAKLLRKPVVLHYHSGEADDHLARWRRTVAPLLRLVDEIVVPSAYLQRVFAAHGYQARVISNLIDTNQFSYRERAPLSPRLLSVRNLEDYYRVENTIAAFARVKARFPDATLTIAGYGTREHQLRRLADRLGVNGIRFLGRVEPAALPSVYDDSDVFVNSSVVDNQPVSILEAFAAGLPVVSTPTGDIATMLRDGKAGLLVKADDPCSMADAVTRLLENPELSLRLSRCAREEAERYTSRRVRDQWTALYATVVNGGAHDHADNRKVLADGA
jgi:glycosyltransferase involved in cell wall biosynthesis/peptidoglycan/xylan/chitin deacetylase (PgdA/CDA1 family)/folate-dependent phosphoribosylglycinamide formyltransferase PurN